jgi:hypothetical protein
MATSPKEVIDLTGDSSPPPAAASSETRVRSREADTTAAGSDAYRLLKQQRVERGGGGGGGGGESEDDDDDDDDSDDDNDEWHHSGELEVNDDAGTWDDHDEGCHGTIDSNSMRREFPEGFTWSCCGASGDAQGCVKGVGESIEEMYATSEGPSSDEDIEHSGELEVDYDAGIWDDHDERCHGPIDTKTNRREFPEGFVWSCCGASGDVLACTEHHDNDSD